MRTTPPTSSYSTVSYATPASRQPNDSRKSNRTIVQLSIGSTSLTVRLIRAIFLACILFTVAGALNWDCPTPRGSYLDSCDYPSGSPYASTDTNLKDVKFCRYTISCKKVNKPDNDKRVSQKILPREDLACGSNWENCDGHLIARSGDSRRCTNNASIREELQNHSLIPRDRGEL